MNPVDITGQVQTILGGYDPVHPGPTAGALRELWLQFEPKSMAGIKAEERAKQETTGTPVAVLRAISKEVGKVARGRVDGFIPLAQILWDEFGREGRIVAVVFLGPMEMADPEKILPLCMTLTRTCVTWEDADQMAMRAVEPIVRKKPQSWLPAIAPWLEDDNKWVRRVGVTVTGRLPMKHETYTSRCLDLIEPLLSDPDTDVKKATSFAIRICARGETEPVLKFLARHVPPEDRNATWVLCDAIRSMANQLLPAFGPLLPLYEKWAIDPNLAPKDKRSVESAVKKLKTIVP
jgi:3-methyladenine DNA glycosylase AlkD